MKLVKNSFLSVFLIGLLAGMTLAEERMVKIRMPAPSPMMFEAM